VGRVVEVGGTQSRRIGPRHDLRPRKPLSDECRGAVEGAGVG
jgi:hypothetical protein